MKNASDFIEKGACAVDISGTAVCGHTAAVDGLTVCTIDEAFKKYGDTIALNFPNVDRTARGLFVCVADGVCIEKPLYIIASEESADNTCILIAEKGSSASIVWLMARGNVNRSIVVEAGARILIRDIVMAESATKLDSNLILAENSSAEIVAVECGAAETQLTYREMLTGREAHAEHYGIFIAADGERKGVDVRVEHLVADCKSDVMIKGVAAGTGRGSFGGMVYVAPDAQHTEAYQQSRNIIIGEQARILTSPQLEIYADDVRCSHGATVGQMNDDAVYYMRQRGLSDTEARRLQLAGFINDIVSHIGEGELADKVSAAAFAKIERM